MPYALALLENYVDIDFGSPHLHSCANANKFERKGPKQNDDSCYESISLISSEQQQNRKHIYSFQHCSK